MLFVCLCLCLIVFCGVFYYYFYCFLLFNKIVNKNVLSATLNVILCLCISLYTGDYKVQVKIICIRL